MLREGAIVKAGTIVVLTEGEYSSYSISTVGRAKVDFKPADLREEYKFANTKLGFLHWLINIKGVVEEIEYYELWTGY